MLQLQSGQEEGPQGCSGSGCAATIMLTPFLNPYPCCFCVLVMSQLQGGQEDGPQGCRGRGGVATILQMPALTITLVVFV
jgi:hypothetical protein